MYFYDRVYRRKALQGDIQSGFQAGDELVESDIESQIGPYREDTGEGPFYDGLVDNGKSV